MLTIPQLLDIAKEKQNLRSDRQLGKLLGRANITPYRTKGEIPTDETAFRLAELCELDAKEVLLTCHLWRIQQGGDVRDAWGQIFKKVVGAVLLAVTVAVSTPPAAYAAAPTRSPAATVYYTLCDVYPWQIKGGNVRGENCLRAT